MTYYELQKTYRKERLMLSVGFALMVLVFFGTYIVQSPQDFLINAGKAFESPREVFGSVIKGMAQK